MSRRPTYLPTLRDVLLAHVVLSYKKPQFIDPFEQDLHVCDIDVDRSRNKSYMSH